MLVLITGGAWQGKSAFARTLAEKRCIELNKKSLEDCVGESIGRFDKESDGECDAEYAIIEDVHLIVKNALEEGRDPLKEVTALIHRHPNVILTVNELGCGIVPMEAFDRSWRETTGRVCCELARRADRVYRVTCGIAMRIK